MRIFVSGFIIGILFLITTGISFGDEHKSLLNQHDPFNNFRIRKKLDLIYLKE